MITKFNLKTPGREDEESTLYSEESGDQALITAIFEALGGKENISTLDNCITRLRIEVLDAEKVANEHHWASLGAKGLVKSGNGIQIIYGTKANILKNRLEKQWK